MSEVSKFTCLIDDGEDMHTNINLLSNKITMSECFVFILIRGWLDRFSIFFLTEANGMRSFRSFRENMDMNILYE